MGRRSGSSEQENQRQAHMTPFMLRVVNPIIKMILLSPLHSLRSARVMVLSFTGRKTGKRYSTPVSYLRQGARIIVFTHSAWRANFKDPAPVQMRIQGKDVAGMAHLVSEPACVKQIVQVLMAANGESRSRLMGFWVENVEALSPEDVRAAIRGTHFLEIEVNQGK